MAKTWLQIRVDLVGSAGSKLDPSPGRILLVGPSHTFEQLADSINQSFGRWDLSHLHEFALEGGRRIGFPNDDFPVGPAWEDHATVKVAQAVAPGDEFSFTFDLGDVWEHRCRVLADKLDIRQEYGPGPSPKQPVVIWGWGSIPDQYGRESAEELEFED